MGTYHPQEPQPQPSGQASSPQPQQPYPQFVQPTPSQSNAAPQQPQQSYPPYAQQSAQTPSPYAAPAATPSYVTPQQTTPSTEPPYGTRNYGAPNYVAPSNAAPAAPYAAPQGGAAPANPYAPSTPAAAHPSPNATSGSPYTSPQYDVPQTPAAPHAAPGNPYAPAAPSPASPYAPAPGPYAAPTGQYAGPYSPAAPQPAAGPYAGAPTASGAPTAAPTAPAGASPYAVQPSGNWYQPAGPYESAPSRSDPPAKIRHWLRKVTNRATGLILVYQVVFTAVSFIASYVISLLIVNLGHGGNATNAQVRAEMVNWNGVLMLVTVLGGLCFILPMRRRMIFRRGFWAGETGHARMKPAWLIVFIVILIFVQVASILINAAISSFGTDVPSPTSESLNESSTNIAMWLYIGLVAPVVEEMVFRGVLMRGLKPIGRNFAILTSALMFGLFHDDVVQGTFAFCLGLLLGFVAMEYSLVWSIVLHAFNNAVLGLLMPWLIGLIGETGATVYALVLLGVGIIGFIVVMVMYGRGLGEYRRANRSPRGTYAAWLAPAFLIFVAINVALTLYSFLTALGVLG
ncbi:CPBP family glutamic-type intramembrane protease [Bifidobacterium leontopitheci]|uniref:CAAX amino protease n=1 Tax=Bifidobacterium leontopitheci TaxID=2650774 RepID=A0A6I1GIV0_9BIFI|nr:CPBP family glutamic-type intramembrane protease [Bifidobacterium leontopitheci]KAB7790642.1 CAAX amino protease [Bifidobacterium leontopitheci]